MGGATMSRRDKLVEKIRARPAEVEFADVRRLLEDFGWTLDRTEGSHRTFTKAGEYPIAIPTVGGRKVKRYYLGVICRRLGLDD
jgi:predicted RNA binding protein YcfA (HicA-like mRNA interferase family)